MRQEIHIHIHTVPEPVEEPIVNRRRRGHNIDLRRESIDIDTLMARTFWSRYLHPTFERGFLVWYHLQGTWADRSGGGTNDGTHLESEEISNGERFRIGCASARGAHISKEKLVDEMIKCGLRLGREKGYEQAVIEQYLETRVQLLSDGYGLKEQTATQLKARIYQGKLELVS